MQYLSNPWALKLMWVLPLLWTVAALARYRRRQRLARLGSRSAVQALSSVRRFRRFLRSTCLVLGLLVLIAAVAGPQWGFEPEPSAATGRDIVVVLDLSRSMLAEDVLPNRLERAKQALDDLADAVQKRGGHRLGLVAFAGQARVVCPLTPDYDHFRTALAGLETTDPKLGLKPVEGGVVSGTRIGLALKQAVELHDSRFRDHQDIVLISDGDDPGRDVEWRRGLAEARARGIPVCTVGIGNPDADSPIPDKEGKPLRHDGRDVRSRLEEAPLREIAERTGGVYTPARLEAPPLAELFRVHIEGRAARDLSDDMLPTLKQRYPWFVGAALALLALWMLIGDRRSKTRRKKAAKESAAKTARGQRVLAPDTTLQLSSSRR